MNGPKQRKPADGQAFEETQPGKLRVDPTLVMLLSQSMDLPDGHCLLVKDATGQLGTMVSGEFMAHCQRVGERASVVNPADPSAAIMVALASLLHVGGVH